MNDKKRKYWLMDSEGRKITRITLRVDCIHLFLKRFPNHKLVRHAQL